MLASLPGCYVLHDIMLPGARGNIDHVVIARSGVAVIETKNWRGTFRCTDRLWEVKSRGERGNPYIKTKGNPTAQVRGNAAMLRRHISARTELDLYVNAIVCFTNPQCELEVYSTTVRLVRLDGLRDAILTQPSSRGLSLEEMSRVWHALLGGGAARSRGGHAGLV